MFAHLLTRLEQTLGEKIRVSDTRSVFAVYPSEPVRQQTQKALFKSTRNRTNERRLRIKYWQRINKQLHREGISYVLAYQIEAVLLRRCGRIPLGNPSDRCNVAKSMLIFSDVCRSNYPPLLFFFLQTWDGTNHLRQKRWEMGENFWRCGAHVPLSL